MNIEHVVFNSYFFIFILVHFETVGEKKAVSHGVTNVLDVMRIQKRTSVIQIIESTYFEN